MNAREIPAPQRLVAMIALLSILFSANGQARDVVTRNVTYTEAIAFLSDERLLGQHAEIVTDAAKPTRAKFRGLANGTILLKDAPGVPLCSARSIKITRKSGGPLRRLAGIVGGALLGMTLVLPVAIAVSLDSEAGFRALFGAMTAMGGFAGFKGVEKRVDLLYLLDRTRQDSTAKPGFGCEK